MRRVWTIALSVVVVIAGVLLWHQGALAPESSPEPSATRANVPLTHWQARVTKKTFGLYVTPTNSPVSPERFTGYHTGADFELLPGEDETTLTVRAICDGTILLARTASGYGGVVVQSCTIDGTAVTIIYGHLNASAFAVAVGTTVVRGDPIGPLGKGYSSQTDGERPHLHLGIHKGTTVNILGYAQTKAGLASWLDPLAILPTLQR